MMIGSSTIIKNEEQFIKSHVEAWLPYLDFMLFYDGGSTDGTLEILRRFAVSTIKVKVVEDKDPRNLAEDYTRISNECLRANPCDMVIFLHPDMLPINGEALRTIPDDAIAASMDMRSFAGEPDGDIYEIQGRGQKWKNIYRLRNPDLGAHYFGAYGAQNEDTYFSEITGNAHEHYGQDMARYPYPVFDTGLIVNHYSDVRPYARRLDRMIKCLVNQGLDQSEAERIAPNHPRVSLKDGQGFQFIKTEINGGTF